MDYYFNKTKFDAKEMQKQKQDLMQNKQEQNDSEQERKQKDMNKKLFTKRTMKHYNAKERAIENNQRLDEYFVKKPPRKKLKMMLINCVDASSSDDEDSDLNDWFGFHNLD